VLGLGVVDEGERVAVGDSKDAALYNLGRGGRSVTAGRERHRERAGSRMRQKGDSPN
jgi:hypothetical protein